MTESQLTLKFYLISTRFRPISPTTLTHAPLAMPLKHAFK